MRSITQRSLSNHGHLLSVAPVSYHRMYPAVLILLSKDKKCRIKWTNLSSHNQHINMLWNPQLKENQPIFLSDRLAFIISHLLSVSVKAAHHLKPSSFYRHQSMRQSRNTSPIHQWTVQLHCCYCRKRDKQS